MDAVSTARCQLLYPPLAERVVRIYDQCESEGIEPRLVQGIRTWAEQDALFAQGRTAPGPPCAHHGVVFPIGACPQHPFGLTVTNCKGGDSYHNYGLAEDTVPSQFAPGQPYDPDWHSQHPQWKRIEALSVAQGLAVGAAWRSFPDAPHGQFTGRFPEGAPSEELKQIFKNGGIQAVWDAVTQSLT